MTPAEQLRAAKDASGLTWPEVARLTGVPLVTLESWTRLSPEASGARTPPAYTLRAVLDQIRAATPHEQES